MFTVFRRKYGVASHIYVPITKRAVQDFAVGADWTPAAGDVKISIDGAAVANVTNLPTAIAAGNGAFWDFSMTAAELTGKKIMVTVVDAATKAVEDQAFMVETEGHASAEHLEVIDALVTDTHAELGGVPAVACSLRDMVRWMFTLSRNKTTQTDSLAVLRNDADNTDLASAAVSDNGVTATRGKFV